MRTLMCLLVGSLLLTLTACGKKEETGPTSGGAAGNPKELIIGKWEVLDDSNAKGDTIEFKEGGEVVMVSHGHEGKGKYRFVEGDLVEFDWGQAPRTLGSTVPVVLPRLKVTVTKDELIVKEAKGKTERKFVTAQGTQFWQETEAAPREQKHKRVN